MGKKINQNITVNVKVDGQPLQTELTDVEEVMSRLGIYVQNGTINNTWYWEVGQATESEVKLLTEYCNALGLELYEKNMSCHSEMINFVNANKAEIQAEIEAQTKVLEQPSSNDGNTKEITGETIEIKGAEDAQDVVGGEDQLT